MINIVICDDEIAFHEIISYKIESCMKQVFKMDFKITCFNDLEKLKKHIEGERVDIVFLDIMVNDQNAMDWTIKNIDDSYVQFIFMTAYPQCAYNISETNCCYFMVKSRMNDETLERAIRRAIKHISNKSDAPYFLSIGSKRRKVNVQDIMYIESLDNNVIFHIWDNEQIRAYSSLKRYEKLLPPNFLRVHKSFMVNLNYIVSYEPYKFVLDDGFVVPVPAKKYTEAVNKYNRYKLSL